MRNQEKVEIICKTHGSFLQRAHDHLAGFGCPKCTLKAQSKLYRKIIEKLPELQLI